MNAPRPAPLTTTDAAANDRAFFGHPTGLGRLAWVEGAIGFSYYGMLSLLVLYMTSTLLKPEHLSRVLGFAPFSRVVAALYGPVSGPSLAAAIMGLYSAAVYATPLVGGLLADRVLGRTRTIALGAALMTLGHFLMAFDAAFLIALASLLLGAGCAGSLKAQIGDLYSLSDRRRAAAFQIYTASVSVAVILAPLICGWLGEKVDWRLGFGAAGAGMAVGLVVYLASRRHLPPEPVRSIRTGARPPPLSQKDWRRVGILALLLPVLALAAVGNQEIFNGYLLWGEAHYDRRLFGVELPVSWLLSLDAFISVATIAASVAFWRWWGLRRREPDEIVKTAIGAGVCALAPLTLALATLLAPAGGRVSLLWGVGFHIVNDVGFANLYAVGLALFSRVAPKALGATIVNAYSLHLFLANLLVGRLAGLVTQMPGPLFWGLHAALIAAAALALGLAARVFVKDLAPTDAPPAPDDVSAASA